MPEWAGIAAPVIRAATVADAAAVSAFARATFLGTFAADNHPDDINAYVDGGAPIEIKRFYVEPLYQGSGLAAALMDAVFERARTLGARTIWLGVWERNARAIAFYHKRGYVQAGSQHFLLGSDLQTDWVMQNTSALR